MEPSTQALVRRRRGLLVVLTVILGLALAAPSIGTAAASTWGQAVEFAPPSNAASNPHAFLGSISCHAPGSCSAVGGYMSSVAGEEEQLMAATETGGTWGQPTAIGLPANAWAAGFGARELNSIACPESGSCVAAGRYRDVSGDHDFHAMIATQTDGTWAQAIEITPPSNASTTTPEPYAGLHSVACSAPGSCVAVGDYSTTTEGEQAMVATETSGTWGQAVEVTAPTNAATGTESIVEFTEVSCPASGSCVAVGRYADTAEHGQAMVATETSGTWGRAVEIASPTNAESNPIAFLGSIDCSAPASCTAVGSYQDNTGHTQAMTATNTGGAWTTSELTPVSETNQELRSVSCPETGSCVAVGDYFSAHSGGQIILKQTGGTWERQATGITPPSNAQSGEAGNLISVSCPALGSCVTVGDYFDTSHYEQAMTASEASGGGSPRGGTGGGSTTGGSSGSGSNTPSAGSTTTTTPATGSVSLDGTAITVTSSGKATIKLTCTGNATCDGKLTLTVKAKGKGKKKAKTENIGTGTFSVPAGKTVTVTLTLTATGRTLLSAAHGKLAATLAILKSSPSPSNTQTHSVHLAQQKAKKGKKK